MWPSLLSDFEGSEDCNLHQNGNISENQESVFDEIEESEHEWSLIEMQVVPYLKEEINNSNQ